MTDSTRKPHPCGEWRATRIKPGDLSPEAHWLRNVIGDRGPRLITIRLKRTAAAYLAVALGKGSEARGAGDSSGDHTQVDGLFDLQEITTGQATYERLVQFGQSRNDGDQLFSVVASGKAYEELIKLVGEFGGEIASVGPSLRPETISVANLATPRALAVPPLRTEWGEDTVIVAIIDDGIGFAHERFRLGLTETRVEYFWDMSQDRTNNKGTDGLCVGNSFDKDRIDGFLRRFPDNDELLYEASGTIDTSSNRRQPLKFRRAHGTHVLDIAAGYDYRNPSERAAAAKRPIFAVQLPSEVISERSDILMVDALRLALDQISEKALELSRQIPGFMDENGKLKKTLPIAVNFSFGTTAGPHDGSSIVEETIAEFLDSYRANPGSPRCECVLPAGNSHLWRVVARLEVQEDGTIESLPWRVSPNDKTSSYLHIWLPEASQNDDPQVRLSLKPPLNCAPCGLSELGSHVDWLPEGKTNERYARAGIYHRIVHQPSGGQREQITVAIRPSENDGDLDAETSPAGIWRLDFENISLTPGTVIDVRIRRDDSLIGQRPTGRQSYFDHPDHRRFEPDTGRIRVDACKEQSPVTRLGTLNGYVHATGPHDPVIVGGYRRSDGEMADYSSSGSLTGKKKEPTLSAVSEEGAYHRGVIAAGTRSGSAVIQNGTSVSTPVITRFLADFIAEGRDRAALVELVRTTDAGGLYGPRGYYKDPDCNGANCEDPGCRRLYCFRRGAGRLFSDQIPPHRRRIDH
jgi:subtilase family protein